MTLALTGARIFDGTHLLEGRARLREALAAAEADPRDRARLLFGAWLVETWASFS
jgi:hypothetical protein